MSSLVEETDDVVIGNPRDAALIVGHPETDSHGNVRIRIQLIGPEVTATGAMELAPWSGGIQRLPSYFDDLASSWTGWPGSRDWRDDSGTVEMSATHDRKARVTLRVSLRDYAGLPTWRIEFDVPLEPGALERIATAIRHLVA